MERNPAGNARATVARLNRGGGLCFSGEVVAAQKANEVAK